MGGRGSGGHNRKSVARHKLEGTFRADRHQHMEEVGIIVPPGDKPPSCPTWLAQEAKREWRRLATPLHKKGLLTVIDRAAFAAYCQAYAEWKEMTDIISQVGSTQRASPKSDGPDLFGQSKQAGMAKARPEVAIRDAAAKRLRVFGSMFGLTPASRQKFLTEASTPKAPNRFEKWTQQHEFRK